MIQNKTMETNNAYSTQAQIRCYRYRYILTKSDIDAIPETKHVHQFNENAIRHTVSLSDIVGLNAFGTAPRARRAAMKPPASLS